MNKKGKTVVSIIILAFCIPIGVLIYSMHQYNASASEIFKLQFHANTETSKQNTPTFAKNNIIKWANQIEEPSILLFYKVNCIRCETTHEHLETAISKLKNQKAKEHVYYVNVESSVGKQLIQKYNITQAATMTVVQKDGQSINYTPTNLVNNKLQVDDVYIQNTFNDFDKLFK